MVNLNKEALENIKTLINEGYALKAVPSEKDNKLCYYRAMDKSVVLVNGEPLKAEISKEVLAEVYDAFKKFEQGNDDHLSDELSKLILVTRAFDEDRQSQYQLLKDVFAPKHATKNNGRQQ